MISGCDTPTYPRLDRIENYPDTAALVQKHVLALPSGAHVADVGGGANPALDAEFIRRHQVDYTLLDISPVELEKAPSHLQKIQVDLTTSPKDFEARVGRNKFDIVFSHFFLEHVRNPRLVHQNIHTALKPGGIAIHFFPTPNILPLVINRLIPERVGGGLIGIFHPARDRKGKQGKFPAYYKWCGNPSKKTHTDFQRLGYAVIQHTGYIGHEYYDRFAPLRLCERALRSLLFKAKIPMTADALLVLRKTEDYQHYGSAVTAAQDSVLQV